MLIKNLVIILEDPTTTRTAYKLIKRVFEICPSVKKEFYAIGHYDSNKKHKKRWCIIKNLADLEIEIKSIIQNTFHQLKDWFNPIKIILPKFSMNLIFGKK